MDRLPGEISLIISNEARLPNKASTTCNHTIGIVASIKSFIKIPSLTPMNKNFCNGMVVKIHDDEYEDCSLHCRVSCMNMITQEDDHLQLCQKKIT